jgi:hypothetical protein
MSRKIVFHNAIPTEPAALREIFGRQARKDSRSTIDILAAHR